MLITRSTKGNEICGDGQALPGCDPGRDHRGAGGSADDGGLLSDNERSEMELANGHSEYTTAAPVSRQVTLPRLPRMGPLTRRWVRDLLETCPRVDDAEQVTAELFSQTVRYGRWDSFILSLTAVPGYARLTMTGAGHPSDHQAHASLWPWGHPSGSDTAEEETVEEHAYGLRLLGTLTPRWGYDGQSSGLNKLWADLTW